MEYLILRQFDDKMKQKVSELKLTDVEMFFILAIKNGLEIQGEELSVQELIGLTLVISDDGLTKLEDLLNKEGIDRIKWNDRMVEALRRSFEKEVDSIERTKEFYNNHGKRHGLEYSPPHKEWNFFVGELVDNSDRVISGIVQNWYHKYWLIQSRKSIEKTVATGCLIPILVLMLLILLII